MGESGQNEFLRGPLALFGVRSGARLVKNLANHRRTPMSPAELILPPSPGKRIGGTNDFAKDIGPVRWPAAAECLTL